MKRSMQLWLPGSRALQNLLRSSQENQPSLLTDSNGITLDDLVGPQSWLLFDLLGIDGDWLALSPGLWEADPDNRQMSAIIHHLAVVNDIYRITPMQQGMEPTEAILSWYQVHTEHNYHSSSKMRWNRSYKLVVFLYIIYSVCSS